MRCCPPRLLSACGLHHLQGCVASAAAVLRATRDCGCQEFLRGSCMHGMPAMEDLRVGVKCAAASGTMLVVMG